MGCYLHQDKKAVDTCSVCGRRICIDCGIIVNGSVMCKDCLLHKTDLMKGLPKLKTFKDGRLYTIPAYSDLFVNPGLVYDVMLTACMIVLTLYIYVISGLSIYTTMAALVTVFLLAFLVYDVNKAMTRDMKNVRSKSQD